MRKFKLVVEDLVVASFATDDAGADRGTVQGFNNHVATGKWDLTCAAPESCAVAYSCINQCPESGIGTCDADCTTLPCV